MPTDTFYRLPEEKRQRLKKAIIGELARVPFAEVSINRIIQAAEIPRGSYYQYFEDKDDLLSYVLQEYKNCLMELLRKYSAEANGDLFLVCRELFDYTLTYGLAEENFAVFRNVFSSLRLGKLLEECDAEVCALRKCGEIEMGDRERLQREILMAVFKDSVARVFSHPDQAEQTKQDFERKLELLRQITEEK